MFMLLCLVHIFLLKLDSWYFIPNLKTLYTTYFIYKVNEEIQIYSQNSIDK